MSRGAWALALTAAIGVLAGSFALLHVGWYARSGLTDIPTYERYAQLIRDGHVPYRDFTVEYPPAALPAFVLPTYLPWSYTTSFAVLMFVCGAGCLAAAAVLLHSLHAGAARALLALGLVAVAPLALGMLFDTRFDLWPAMLTLAALAALLRERAGLAGLLLGFAAAAKLWPLVLAPIGLAFLWRRLGRRGAVVGVLSFAAGAAFCVVPFALLAPGGVWHSLTEQLRRPLQVESLGASLLMAAHHVGGLSLTTITSHGSQNLSGSLAAAAGAATTTLQIAVLLGIWIAYALQPEPSRETTLVACAAAVAAFVAFGKVFSPQFLIWLVPLVPLVRGRRGLAAAALLGAALVLTDAWFSSHYWPLALHYASPWSWLLLLRDLAVVAIAVVLLRPSPPGDEVRGTHRARLAALEAIRQP
ncbi:MAG TPA: glycosyltransferase 87 family protein [Gaiellaceae bacterium]|nr:glycosyltransferase 87 family protein [Gaiellaceae bacterium]